MYLRIYNIASQSACVHVDSKIMYIFQNFPNLSCMYFSDNYPMNAPTGHHIPKIICIHTYVHGYFNSEIDLN